MVHKWTAGRYFNFYRWNFDFTLLDLFHILRWSLYSVYFEMTPLTQLSVCFLQGGRNKVGLLYLFSSFVSYPITFEYFVLNCPITFEYLSFLSDQIWKILHACDVIYGRSYQYHMQWIFLTKINPKTTRSGWVILSLLKRYLRFQFIKFYFFG